MLFHANDFGMSENRNRYIPKLNHFAIVDRAGKFLIKIDNVPKYWGLKNEFGD